MSEPGGLIVGLEEGSFGEQLGLRVGDCLLSINGHRLRDVLDFQFYSAEDEVTLTVQRAGRVLALSGRRRDGQGWGVEFSEPVFDCIRTCGNRCPFCFLSGLPAGLRPSLYVRDDDYRLSFLFGNFVTLTNLEDSDWRRLEEQRLSPLHVSVQATEPDLRRRLLGGRPVPDILSQIRRLGEIGIVVEAQVVICPGINDGIALERTLADLWALRSVVESVAVVPVGLTSHHPLALRPVTRDLALEILALAARWRRLAYREVGRRFVYPADELYLLAGQPLPGARSYDGFPQLANGVGLVRRFLDDWARIQRRLIRRRAPPATVRSATLVSGLAFLPFLEKVADGLTRALGVRCQALGVINRFFGPAVTVAGLLTARDVLEQLRGRDLGELVILPRSMFDAAGERTLDDWTPARIAQALGRPVALAGMPGDVVALLMEWR